MKDSVFKLTVNQLVNLFIGAAVPEVLQPTASLRLKIQERIHNMTKSDGLHAINNTNAVWAKIIARNMFLIHLLP